MNSHEPGKLSLTVEPGLAKQLQCIDGEQQAMTQQRANALLARMAWSRICEPGDGTAGGLVQHLGPEAALALLIEGVSAVKLRAIAHEAGFEMSVRTAQESLGRWLPRLDRAATVGDLERAVEKKLHVVVPGDVAWSPALDDLGLHAPMTLWVRGSLTHLARQSLSVVGARAATGYGTHVTSELVSGVCATGITIVSGAAYGIDAVAHRTALALDSPTIAVLAGGADRPYPRAHEQLLGRISEAGAVCSEMVPGSAPTKWRFLMRNRLIAALSQATLITEAGVNSGSINTAGHASQLGREIAAVPGPVTSAASAGCHKLIREYGATLVTNAREVCELIGVNEEQALFGVDSQRSGREHSWHVRVLDAIPLRGSRETHEIARLAGFTVEQAMNVLVELELLGRVKRQEQPGEASLKWMIVRPQ